MEIIVLVLVAILSPFAGLIAGIRLVYATFSNRAKAWTIALSWDDLMNVVANGYFGQTISHRAATAKQEGRRWGCILCRWLDAVDPGPPAHCDKALTDSKQNLKQ